VHQKFALKFDFCLCLGVHLQISPTNYTPKFLSSALGLHVHPVHPLAMPMEGVLPDQINCAC